MSGSAGAIRAGRAFVEIFTDSSAMARGLKAASRKLAAWGASVRNLGLKFSAAGAAIVTPIVDSARRWAEAGAEMAHMSERTGVSVEALSALGYVAERSGTSLEAVVRGTLVDASRTGIDSSVRELRSIRPGRPRPTYRYAGLADAQRQ